jgi:hypothetical protein
MNWDNPFKTTTIKTIKPGHKLFKISNGFMTSDRASIEIKPNCPSNIANLIAQAHNNGWITAVAHVTEKEYVLMGLSNG